MGQRSEIYLRVNGNLKIASYYNWNYGERMISRARHSIEYLKNILEEASTYRLQNETELERIRRYFDVNFDMQDIVMSTNIIKEHQEEFPKDVFCDFVYNYESCDGKLFIDITYNEVINNMGHRMLKDYSIKYAFLDDGCNTDHIMNAYQYMNWDCKGWNKSDQLSTEEKAYTKDNIAYLLDNISVLTKSEIIDFLNSEA